MSLSGLSQVKRGLLSVSIYTATVLLSGCTTTSLNEAPIEDRSERRTSAPNATTATPVPPLQREAKDGTYTVQRGDTLYSIALAFGQDYRDLARWNGLDDPSRLRLGQSLRVEPPAAELGSAANTTASTVGTTALPVPAAGGIETRSLETPQGLPAAAPTSAAPAVPPGVPASNQTPNAQAPSSMTTPAPTTGAATAPNSAATTPTKPSPVEPVRQWLWPVPGKVIEAFNETRNKGIDIAGKEGEPVMAAGDGQVVYSGGGLRGYGNLVIVKHTDDYISAYAHNKQNLVKQGQTVKRGQKIAELGKTDADVPKLHFEIRRQGKPVDPLKYLPAR